MGVLEIFNTGTYAILGTRCVESATCYEKNHQKKKKYEEYDFCLGTEKQLAGVAKFDQLSYVCFINIIKEFNVYQTR